MSINTILVTFIILPHRAFPGVSKWVTLSIDKYGLAGTQIAIGCTVNNNKDTEKILLKIEDHELFHFFKDKSEGKIIGRYAENKTTVVSSGWPKFKILFYISECSQSLRYGCMPYYDGTTERNIKMTAWKNLTVLDNRANITMSVQEPANRCNGTSEECMECKDINGVRGYVKNDETFTVYCKKEMPFPYNEKNANTFTWYRLLEGNNGKITETEIKIGTSGNSPSFSKGNSAKPYNNKADCLRRENKTSSLTYTPTHNDGKLITVRCRADFNFENLRDSKQTQLTICRLGNLSNWLPWSKCTDNCTRSKLRKCIVSKCTDETEKHEVCTRKLCRKGYWSDWLPWTNCSETCTRLTNRTCLVNECTLKEEILEKCVGDYCKKEATSDKMTSLPPAVPILVAFVAVLLLSIINVILFIKYRKRKSDKKTTPKIKSKNSVKISECGTNKNKDKPSSASSQKQQLTPNKDPGSKKEHQSKKEVFKEDEKTKKTRNECYYTLGKEDYYDESDDDTPTYRASTKSRATKKKR